MKTNISRLMLVVLFVMPAFANASAFSGKIQTIRINTGTSAARVSILVGAHGSPCATSQWFAYENASVDQGGLLTPAFIDAANNGRTVFIQGTGTCDTFAVEKIDYVDFK